MTEVMENNHEEETNGCVLMPQMIQMKMKSLCTTKKERTTPEGRVFLFRLWACIKSTAAHHFPSPYIQKQINSTESPNIKWDTCHFLVSRLSDVESDVASPGGSILFFIIIDRFLCTCFDISCLL